MAGTGNEDQGIYSVEGYGMTIHVTPINDLREHIESLDCWCEPHSEWIDEDTGLPYAAGPLVVHNALDGRE